MGKTTVVGAWVEGAVKNWFTEEEDGRRMMGRAWRPQLKENVEDEDAKVRRMVESVVEKQACLGFDIVTDGEVGREGYYMHTSPSMRFRVSLMPMPNSKLLL